MKGRRGGPSWLQGRGHFIASSAARCLRVKKGEIDHSFVITHSHLATLHNAPMESN